MSTPTAADWRKLARDLANAINAVDGAVHAADETWNPLMANGTVRVDLWQAVRFNVASAALLAKRAETLDACREAEVGA